MRALARMIFDRLGAWGGETVAEVIPERGRGRHRGSHDRCRSGAEIVEQVLAAAAARQRQIGEVDVREIAKAGAKAAILQGIEADQKVG